MTRGGYCRDASGGGTAGESCGPRVFRILNPWIGVVLGLHMWVGFIICWANLMWGWESKNQLITTLLTAVDQMQNRPFYLKGLLSPDWLRLKAENGPE